ncbi:EamA family transporter [Mucilaginibacter lappiensis]|uniref:Drug/metabolite transporter (DMT)-like permease n=1 Tax=Mucilaginibacter lappiensis TaxID=354630 RepID=A0A1N6UQZ6_9SPHI|nr:EamA family transporter [Mucilaginibacter lappiensis]MBB6108925.1 drug/metabolite transporter (DMT)-like permease [Mucilaginibacter lappiensis]MBB6130519.1 drug/metabolite transporter (DMT)-like permease [Mucilaginibacter lappiensis]SIQ68065.1 Permease of the drug/metabolite transporter (DMT) superfamily [Mucilaginibacter lappiensis]
MALTPQKSASPLMVIIAFATVYIVWGSTYFFIKMAVDGFPPLLLGALRFLTAGILLLTWCKIKGEQIFIKRNIIHAAVTGFLLLVIGNGAVIWVEQTLPSAMVAIMVSSAPIWFVLFDKQNWRVNFKNTSTIVGLIIGFAGVVLLFSEQIRGLFDSSTGLSKLPGMLLLLIGAMSWASGSLYSKYNNTQGSASVNTAWQMLAAGLVFLPSSFLTHEVQNLQWQNIPTHSWLALLYLIIFGSIAAFSAYVWLLQVRPATQVSTYAYVNPVIAVILGVLFAHESITLLQVGGLVIILGSVLLINLSKYRKEKQAKMELA